MGSHKKHDEDEVYFRGDLKVVVNKATDLPNADGRNIKAKFESFLSLDKGKKKDLSDPYVNICIDDHKILQTKVIKDELNPVWNESFETEVSHEGSRLMFWVWDDDTVGKEKLGHAYIKLNEIIEKKVIRRTIDLTTPFGKCRPTIDVEVEFEPVSAEFGVFEVTKCYFPARHSGEVVLYQDACCLPSPLHSKFNVHGAAYRPRSAWDDILETINKAQRFVYFTGWSMTHNITLNRERGTADKDNPYLGDLLIDKANQGVKVLVLLWDEPLNNDTLEMNGIVGTNDEKTRTFFARSKVNCVLAARRKSKRGMLETLVSNTSFSHHQKTVIADDADADSGIVAYLGGLDLTTGRYDDQNHYLFKSCKDKHKEDFYQTFPGIVNPDQGPRQPWHDVHARVSGEAAIDVLTNFKERWKIEAPKEINHIPPEDSGRETPSKWRIQIFRSIPNDAALFDELRRAFLQSKHGQKYEASIHRAYISAIRNAEKFLYIENQYFLGSAHSWIERGCPRANHLIPVEIAEQICEHIEKKKRFAAYIIIPLFPEGDPGAPHIQEIIHWQATTIRMMYRKVAKAIKKAELPGAHPCDYLNFFCLGKREAPPASFMSGPDDTPARKMTQAGRGMIYVHSKAMVVDDIYSIVGSANINQRSMDGRRDTEIAVGCWEREPNKLINDGHVQGLRKGLWSEHLDKYEPVFDDPSSLECVKRVRQLCHDNWEMYHNDRLAEGESCPHMLQYPIKVSFDGEITPLLPSGFFPDTIAPILGTKSSYLPSRLTV